ncbi:MAG: hypothetical protein AB2813_01650 [Candidatus Sedimenticola endophacoides]
MKALPPQTSLDLIHLFDTSSQPIFGNEGQRLLGIPAWELDKKYPDLSQSPLSDWLTTSGYAGVIEVDFDDEQVHVEIEEDNDPGLVGYRDPNTLQWKTVPLQDTVVRQVAEQSFLHSIADLLDIPQAQRNGISHPEIPGTLWLLGNARLGDGMHNQIWLVRNLESSLPEIVAALDAKGSTGLLLCTSKKHSDYINLPSGIALCSLADTVVQHLDDTCLDKDWLYRQILGTPDSSKKADFPIEFDRYSKTLVIRGKAPWVLKGDKQAKAVEYMYQQALKGRWELSPKEILAAAHGKGHTGGAKRLSSLFSSNVEWVDYIANPRRGIYSFNLS